MKTTALRSIAVVCTAIFLAVYSYAAEPKDTIVFNGNITQIVEDTQISTKGKKTTKYYFLVNSYLIPTTKSTVEKYRLCKKYNAKCPLYSIVSKKTKQTLKIIHQ